MDSTPTAALDRAFKAICLGTTTPSTSALQPNPEPAGTKGIHHLSLSGFGHVRQIKFHSDVIYIKRKNNKTKTTHLVSIRFIYTLEEAVFPHKVRVGTSEPSPQNLHFSWGALPFKVQLESLM